MVIPKTSNFKAIWALRLIYNMPQAIPTFFVNQITWTILGLAFVVFILSTYILPYVLHLLVSRVYITKL